MTLKRKKRLAVGLLTLALVGLSSMTALANNFNYSGELPAYQGHITLVAGSSEKTYRGSEYAYNKVSELGNDNDFMYCWIDNTTSGGRTKATGTVKCRLGIRESMQYKDHYWSGSAELRAHASDWGFQKTHYRGYIEFG